MPDTASRKTVLYIAFIFILFSGFAGGNFQVPARISSQLCRPEHKTVVKPVVAHEQITGELFIIEIGLCEVRQVVTFFNDLVGEIFFIVILSLILVLKVPYKVVRIFLAQIMAFVVAP